MRAIDYTPLLWIAAVPAIVAGQIYVLGRKMSRPELMMRPIAGGLNSRQQQILLSYKDWLASVNLELRTSFQFGMIQAAVFQQADQARFFSFLFHQTTTFGAGSSLEALTVLDTSGSADGGVFPRPGA